MNLKLTDEEVAQLSRLLKRELRETKWYIIKKYKDNDQLAAVMYDQRRQSFESILDKIVLEKISNE